MPCFANSQPLPLHKARCLAVSRMATIYHSTSPPAGLCNLPMARYLLRISL